MTQDERERMEKIEGKLSVITDTLLVTLENHLNHLESYAQENRDMIEQVWGMAESSEQSSRRTEKTVKAAAVFLGLVISIVACFT